MSDEITCKRCSIARVNILCRLYEKILEDNDTEARDHLKQLVDLATKRGYIEGQKIWEQNFPLKQVRALCWNISSLLTDRDFEVLGLKVKSRYGP